MEIYNEMIRSFGIRKRTRKTTKANSDSIKRMDPMMAKSYNSLHSNNPSIMMLSNEESKNLSNHDHGQGHSQVSMGQSICQFDINSSINSLDIKQHSREFKIRTLNKKYSKGKFSKYLFSSKKLIFRWESKI